ncbi:MAG: peptide ABC transporter substrate-binding protein [Patescibacteria group bacterium]
MFYKFSKLYKSFSLREQKLFIGAAAVLFVSGITLALVLYYQNTTAQPVEGGSYTEGIIGQPVAINPLIAGENDADRDLIALTFASLSDLAEKYESDAEQKNWTITLKPDLKWSDGEPINSEDVIFTIGIVQDPDARSPLFATWQSVATERLSELELRITLKNTYAFFRDNIQNLRIAPKHIFDGIPPQNFRLSEFSLQPVGSGPYRVVGYEKRPDGFIEEYTLTANKHFAGQKPFIKNFSVRFFPNKTEAISAFNSKSVDGLGGLEAKDLENLKISREILNPGRSRYYAIFLNPNTSLALKEKDVRQALNLATDRAQVITSSLVGEALPAFGPIPQNILGYDESVYAGEEFSPEKANALLDKAGWKLNEKGIREKVIQKTTVPLEFDLVIPESRFLSETANELKDMWKVIGVKINPAVLKSADILSGIIKPRNYQMILFGNTLNKNADIFSFWHSSQRFDPGLNLSLFNDKNVDTALESVRQTLDGSARNALLSKVQKTIHDNWPAVFLYSPNYLYATSRSLGGFPDGPIAYSSNRFDNVNLWYLKTARIFSAEGGSSLGGNK